MSQQNETQTNPQEQDTNSPTLARRGQGGGSESLARRGASEQSDPQLVHEGGLGLSSTGFQPSGSREGHGGARSGAGRKPKALRYAKLADQIEERIALALPRIIDAMIERAQNGDNAASRYLCDRILGKPAKLPAAPANDTDLPYNDKQFQETLEKNGYLTEYKPDTQKIKQEILSDTEVDIEKINDHYCVYRLNDIENAKLNFDYNRSDRILKLCGETMACEDNADNPDKFFHYLHIPVESEHRFRFNLNTDSGAK